MTADEQTTGPVWRDRGTIIANQQARIAELEAACQRLRDDYQGALAERNEARAEVERLRRALGEAAGTEAVLRGEVRRLMSSDEAREAAEADAAGLRARIEALCDDTSRHLVRWIDDSHLVDVSDVRAALAAEPTPAAEPHAEDVDETYWAAHTSDGRCKYPTLCREDPALTDHRPAPVADPDDTKGGQQ